MHAMMFVRRAFESIARAFEVFALRCTLATLRRRRTALERARELAQTLERVETTLDRLDVASREIFEAIRLELAPTCDGGPPNAEVEDEAFRSSAADAFVEEIFENDDIDVSVREKVDKRRLERRVREMLREYRDFTRRDASKFPLHRRLYHFADAHLSRLDKFRGELRSRPPFTKDEELRGVIERITEVEEKLSVDASSARAFL
jgi:hypothetical protein